MLDIPILLYVAFLINAVLVSLKPETHRMRATRDARVSNRFSLFHIA